MNYIIGLVLATLLAFSYKIMDRTVGVTIGRTLYRRIGNDIIYIWGIMLTVIIYFYKDNYVFRLPTHYESIIPFILIMAIANIFVTRYSGYHPLGKKNVINFVIMYPIFEEVIFRGMILPLLNNTFPVSSSYELFYMPVTLSILITAFLFAVSHLQYYSLNKESFVFMLFAFSGGIVFGVIADYTQSIVIPLFLHLVFNSSAFYYSRKNTIKAYPLKM